jgi:hypothetical protein
MAKQLIFCSVPHGLQPGRSGYCLMAGHSDLPQSLIRQLEQETSVFPPNEKEDHPSRHERRQIGGTEWHLFTRQTTGIKDYTGRSSGLTHVIAERVADFPTDLDPKRVLWAFKSWVTAIPDKPKVYGLQEEIQLSNMVSKPRPVSGTEPISKEEPFMLNPDANRIRPVPMPRRGMYYDRKRRNKRWPVLISLTLIAVALAAIWIF